MSHTAQSIKSEKPPTSSENLEHYKDQVMKDVQKVQGVLNEKVEIARKHYVDPAQEFVLAQAHARPIMTVERTLGSTTRLLSLLGVFFALSFFPIVTFVLFSLGAILTIGGTALVISLVMLSFVIGTALALLTATLFITGFLSLCAMAWVLGVYAFVRLGQNLLQEANAVEGLKSYYAEMHGLVFGTGHGGHGRSEGKDGKNVTSHS
ncbi:BQ2448_3777 [Microbotryum intermedium]|uniref:BQ2448_3777 protein n=1 Tax=Microbotryum intermedium TaxID=269621 RepID=A0A238FCU9_9BASI|nr:BQ2448_3777 [Microbotryum intermedium]